MSKQRRQKQRVGLLIAFLVLSYFASQYSPEQAEQAPENPNLETLYQQQRSHVQVAITAQISRILSDDTKGSRHQRFIIQLGNGQTILIAHNIDLAPRIPDLQPGDIVTIYGEYEWNPQGGVIHWTHHDPAGKHPDGWIEYRGKRYQ